MLGPMMNAALLVVSFGAVNVFCFDTVVECFRRYVSNMPETIPLSAALRVQFVFVIVRNTLITQRLNLMLKGFSTEARNFRDIEWQIERYNFSGLDLLRCRRDTGWS
jgi:hypothetical protein